MSFPFSAYSLYDSPHPPHTLCHCLYLVLLANLVSLSHLLQIVPVSLMREWGFFFHSQCLSAGVFHTTGIKEPLQTGCGAYLKQQACH